MITLEIDNRRVLDELNAMIHRLADPKPAFEEIGEYLVMSTKRRFSTKTGPDGSPWARNTLLTQKLKGRDDPLVGESGRLSSEIYYRADASGVEWGSAMEYAAMQQFGGSRSSFPHLWGNIPARPFLGVADQDETTILDILGEYVLGE